MLIKPKYKNLIKNFISQRKKKKTKKQYNIKKLNK